MSSVLMGVALKSVVVLGAAWVAALVARKRSAAARHAIWNAAMLALLALPLLSLSLPALHVAAADRVWEMTPAVTFASDAFGRTDGTAMIEIRADGSRSSKSAPWHPDWGLTIALIWAAGAALGCVRLILAVVAMRRLRSASKAVEEDFSLLSREMGIRRQVRVLETAAGSMPMTFGWMKPSIFLPADASGWSAERRRAVLLHELAHIRRGDVATQFLARLALSLYWWNPLAWSAWREFLKMRERAADDLVLEAGTRATDYARHLVEVARSAAACGTRVAVAMAQPSQLEGRVTAILDARVNHTAPGRVAAAAIMMAAVAMVAPVAAIHAQDAPTLPADVDAAIRVAASEKNFESLDRVAAGFAKIGQYDTAQKVLEAALLVRSSVAGEQSAVYADGLVKLGNFAQLRGKGNAKAYYEKAAALGDRPATASALLYLGIVSLRKEPTLAAGYLQRAINTDSRGPKVAEAMAWMGAALGIQGNNAEAESMFSRAASMGAEASPGHAMVMEMFAHFLAEEGRKDEAEALQARAFQIRKEHFASLSPKVADSVAPSPIGGGTKPPSVATKVEPEYSLEARVDKIQGSVTMQVVIGTDGKAGNMTLKNGIGYGLDEKALEAVSKWQFNPSTNGGVAVPVMAAIQVNFRLL